MSIAPSQLGAFTRSAPALAWPDLQHHVQLLSLDAFGEPLHPFDAFTASVCNLTPNSRGHVRIVAMPVLVPYQPQEFRPGVQGASTLGGRHRHHHRPPREYLPHGAHR